MSASEHGRKRGIPTWRVYASKYGLKVDPPALREILDMLDRVVVRGEGWGPADALRGNHRAIRYSPTLMARRAKRRQTPADGGKKSNAWSACTYRRALRAGEAMGVVLVNRSARGMGSLIAPAWWRHPADYPDDPLLADRVWRGAAARQLSADGSASDWVVIAPPVHTLTGQNLRSRTDLRMEEPERSAGTEDRRPQDRGQAEDQDHADPLEGRPTRPRLGARWALPIEDPKLWEIAERILQEVRGISEWDGLEGLIRGELAEGSEEDSLIPIVNEAYEGWRLRGIQYPKAWIRHVLVARGGGQEGQEMGSATNHGRVSSGFVRRI